jgi:aminobenzoyl-glutamate utilization protein B
MKPRNLEGLCLMLLATLIPVEVSVPAAPDADKEAAFHWLDANADAMRKVSLNIWNAAELALHEYKSSRALMAYLENNGFALKRESQGCRRRSLPNYGSGKPVIAIYGEYDALAGLLQKAESSFAPLTEGAPGHGCGHNLIGAGSAAAVVSKLMKAGKIKRTLRFYGTPAEESVGGKAYMLEAGLFNDVDVLLGWHPQDVTTASFQCSKAVASMRFKFMEWQCTLRPHQRSDAGRALKGVELTDRRCEFLCASI